MTELTEAEQQKLNTGRLMRAESEILLPYLETKERLVAVNIVQAFRAGNNDRLQALAAELSTLHEMRAEINRKIKTAESLEKKLYEGDL